jgi:hypothetical protein
MSAGGSFVILPPHSPDPRLAEQPWQLLDEPIVGRDIITLDALRTIVAARCRQPIAGAMIRARASARHCVAKPIRGSIQFYSSRSRHP